MKSLILSLLFITSAWSFRVHLVSTHNQQCVGFCCKMLLMSFFISPAVSTVSLFVLLSGCEMGGRWPYNCCFQVCCFLNLFKTAHLAFSPSISLAPRWCKHTVVLTWPQVGKKSHFLRTDFHMVDNLSIAVHVCLMHMLTLVSVDEIWLPRYVKWSTNFKGLPFNVEVALSCLKHTNYFLLGVGERSDKCFKCVCVCVCVYVYIYIYIYLNSFYVYYPKIAFFSKLKPSSYFYFKSYISDLFN